MAAFNKFNSFVEAIAEGVHNFSTATLKVALTNTTPTSANSQLSNITEISYTNLSSRTITTTSSSQSSGTYSLVLADLTLTATGSVGPFQYVVIYNDSATNDELIGWYDYGQAITMANGETFTIDFSSSLFTLA